MKKNRKPQPISRDYYESLKDAANYLDFALTELDGGDRYETMSTLLDARLMVLNVVPSQQFEELEQRVARIERKLNHKGGNE